MRSVGRVGRFAYSRGDTRDERRRVIGVVAVQLPAEGEAGVRQVRARERRPVVNRLVRPVAGVGVRAMVSVVPLSFVTVTLQNAAGLAAPVPSLPALRTP